jgi:membrane-bound serine protease (ClpP class)
MTISVLAALFGAAGFARPSAGVGARAGARLPTALPPAALPAAPALTGHIDVAQMNGLIDSIEVDFLTHAIAGALSSNAEALVVQLDSSGGVISQTQIDNLVRTIADAQVPIAVWVGPNGSRALGAGYAIWRAAAIRGVAPGTRVGDSPRLVSETAPDPLVGRTIGAGEAISTAIAQLNQPTLGDFIVNLDGRQVGGKTLQTAVQIRGPNGEPRRQPSVGVRFEKINLLQQLLHTAASPSVAYLMLLVGLLLVILEFFTAGIGIAAACGAVTLVLASYGLGVLPFRGWALLLIGVGLFGFCVDLQAGVPRVWTAVGTLALIVGSLALYHGVHISLLALVAGALGTPLFMVAGMPAMVRARFSTSTIGRQSLVGEMGVALAAVEPEGTVQVRGAPWRARTNRATPIAAGDAIRVVSIDGLLLEVEPETGGARDAHH